MPRVAHTYCFLTMFFSGEVCTCNVSNLRDSRNQSNLAEGCHICSYPVPSVVLRRVSAIALLL